MVSCVFLTPVAFYCCGKDACYHGDATLCNTCRLHSALPWELLFNWTKCYSGSILQPSGGTFVQILKHQKMEEASPNKHKPSADLAFMGHLNTYVQTWFCFFWFLKTTRLNVSSLTLKWTEKTAKKIISYVLKTEDEWSITKAHLHRCRDGEMLRVQVNICSTFLPQMFGSFPKKSAWIVLLIQFYWFLSAYWSPNVTLRQKVRRFLT